MRPITQEFEASAKMGEKENWGPLNLLFLQLFNFSPK